MTRDELANQIIFTLGLQDDTTFSETDYVHGLIHQGITDIAAKTRAYSRCIDLTLTASTAVHDMTLSIIAIKDLSDEHGTLDSFTREDIEIIQRQGGRGYAYDEPRLWISPVSGGIKTIRVDGVFRPQKMTNGSQSPSHPDFGGLADEFHPTIVTYCLWKGGEYAQHEASGNGEKWRVQYQGQEGMGGELASIRRILNKRVTPGGPRRRNPLRTVGSVPDLSYYAGG